MFLTGKHLVTVDLFFEIFVDYEVSSCRFPSSSGTNQIQKPSSYRQAFHFRNDKLLKMRELHFQRQKHVK